MNSLLILSSELTSSSTAKIVGERRKYLLERHSIKVGITLQGGILNGERVKVTIVDITEKEVLCELNNFEDSLEKNNVSLVVGLSRPQTMKKVIHIAITGGVSSLDITMTKGSEKSYLQSKIYNESELQKIVIEALEQAGYTIVPKIRIHRTFSDFVYFWDEECLKKKSVSYVCSTLKSFKRNPVIEIAEKSYVSLAVGSEKGWSPRELSEFTKRNFLELSLGQRMLRVEYATSIALGMLRLG